MALKSTIFKVSLDVADVDRGYYGSHALTLARHPSETDERMMLRVLAFALHAGDGLAFGTGLSTEDEPDLWRKGPTGDIELWIDLGQPDPRRVRKACGRADEVVLYCYGGGKASVWWSAQQAALGRHGNLTVRYVPAEQSAELAALAERDMQIQCNVQDGEAWMIADAASVRIAPEPWLTPKPVRRSRGTEM